MRDAMMNFDALPHVVGKVVYVTRLDEKLHTLAYDTPPGVPRTNQPSSSRHPRSSTAAMMR